MISQVCRLRVWRINNSAITSRCRPSRAPPIVLTTGPRTYPYISQTRVNSGYDHGDKSYYKNKPRKRKEDSPFFVLGVSEDSKYSDAKKSFLMIAMKHHPDTAGSLTEDEQTKSRDIFIEARTAFEALAEGPDGMAILAKDGWKDEDFDEWFRDETGHDMPFMDAATMKEVAQMTDSVGGGLDRDGGMWFLARMVTENVKSGGDAQDILKLEAGTVRDRSINGILRRRRKR